MHQSRAKKKKELKNIRRKGKGDLVPIQLIHRMCAFKLLNMWGFFFLDYLEIPLHKKLYYELHDVYVKKRCVNISNNIHLHNRSMRMTHVISLVVAIFCLHHSEAVSPPSSSQHFRPVQQFADKCL